jgi:hypothetical protein
MGLTIGWAIRCNDIDCVRRVINETAKFSEKNRLTHQRYSPNHILSCTGHQEDKDAGVCFEFNFEPWDKALKQSYIMRRAKFKVLGFGDKIYDGTGVFGHSIPDDMMRLIDGRLGTRTWQSIEGEPNLGQNGYQTGDWVKTQYHGVEHHIMGCKILDNVRKHADKMLVDDDGDYCGEGDKHDLKKLMDSFEEYTEINKSIGGMLRGKGWSDDQIKGAGEDDYQRLKSGR